MPYRSLHLRQQQSVGAHGDDDAGHDGCCPGRQRTEDAIRHGATVRRCFYRKAAALLIKLPVLCCICLRHGAAMRQHCCSRSALPVCNVLAVTQDCLPDCISLHFLPLICLPQVQQRRAAAAAQRRARVAPLGARLLLRRAGVPRLAAGPRGGGGGEAATRGAASRPAQPAAGAPAGQARVPLYVRLFSSACAWQLAAR